MRVAILAYGSRGDIQPMVVLGDELRRRGHSVVLTVNENLAEWAGRSGLDIVPMRPDLGEFLKSDTAKDTVARGRIFSFLKALGAEERRANRSIIDACVTACTGADLVLTTVLTTYRGECLARAFGVPHRRVGRYPTLKAGNHASFASPVHDLRFGRLNRASWRMLEFGFWLGLRPNIDEMCDVPRCRAAVHHGGSGTTAAVLRAGLPSVVAGVLADQAYWAWRIEQLGAGVRLPFGRITGDRLGAAVDAALRCGPRAAALGTRIAAEDANAAAADVVERWAVRLGIQPVAAG